MRKKLLFVSQVPPFPVFSDGATLRTFYLLREFSKTLDCYLICFNNDASSATQTIEWLGGERARQIALKRTPRLLATLRKIISPLRLESPEMKQALVSTVKEFRPDYVFVEQAIMAIYREFLGSAPNLLSSVDALSLHALKQSKLEKLWYKKKAWNYVEKQRMWLESFYFKQYDCVTAVAAEDAIHLETVIRRRVEVVPNGVDTDLFRPLPKEMVERGLAFSGSLDAAMNEEAAHFLASKIYPAVSRRIPRRKYVIAGRNPSKRLKEAGFPGFELRENPKDIRMALSDCDVFVAPIDHGTGIKNSVLQAMALGMAVICTPNVAAPIGIIDGYNGFIRPRTEALADEIVEIINNKSALRAVSVAGCQHVKANFEWAAVAEKYRRCFRSESEKINSYRD
jgi:glycosyltransferase involved in cell wall biosynthesis